MFSLNCRAKLLDLTIPKVMGVINLTPDSYLSASRKSNAKEALVAIEQMLEEGVDIVDLGAMSSRPGASQISAPDEIFRLKEPLLAIRKEFPDLILSVDTFQAEVMKFAIEEGGIDMINDISSGIFSKKEILQKIIDQNIAYVAMHMKGTPSDMQNDPNYEQVNLEILNCLKGIVYSSKKVGINSLVIDPGIGFGKTIEHNFTILKGLGVYKILEVPILIGISRKSFIYKTLNISPEESLPATSAMHLTALENGANILRVHEVKEAKQVISLWQNLNKGLMH